MGDSRGVISLQVNSEKKNASTHFWIRNDNGLYMQLLAHRDAIEARSRFGVEWDEKPGRKASALFVARPGDFIDPHQ